MDIIEINSKVNVVQGNGLFGTRKIPGKVLAIRLDPHSTTYTADSYLVEYDDSTLIPPRDWHSADSVFLSTELGAPQIREAKCECGAASLGYGTGSFHSSWCPRFRAI